MPMLSQASAKSNPPSQNSAAIARLAAIFTHRWGFIHRSSSSPHWLTETAYPLSDADLWEFHQSEQIFIGVRFGAATRYGMLDVDISSPYHPKQDPSAIGRIESALEAIGIYRSLLVQSSESGGLHLYLPFDQEISTFALASTLKATLERAGFRIAAGTLELFPHPKTYRVDRPSSYNGHRLPLQQGSCLLDDDFNPISDSIESFLNAFDIASYGNNLNEFINAAEKIIQREKKLKRKRKEVRISQRGYAWRESLERTIEAGWTGFHQTNELLGKLAQYGRVFLHLEGDELSRYCLKTAQSLPGYEQYCRHQIDLEQRCVAWAKSAQYYYTPYCSDRSGGHPWKSQPRKESAHNKEQAIGAVDRIKQAITELRKAGTLIVGKIAQSLQAIATAARCSLSTLYKHRNLWQDAIGCNGSNNATEAIPEANPEQIENRSESLKTREGKPLHPKRDYEGVGMKFSSPDQPNQANPGAMDTRRAPFTDRVVHRPRWLRLDKRENCEDSG